MKTPEQSFVKTIMPTELPDLPIGKWLAPKEVAGHFGLNEDSAYNWINDGTISRRYIRYCGRMRMRIHPAVLAELEKEFEAAHD